MFIIKRRFQEIQKQHQMKVKELPYLLQRIATLLNEGYLLMDCITMLLPYHVKNFAQWQKNIQTLLEHGALLVEIFKLFGLRPQHLLAIHLAQHNGQLSQTLQAVSQQMIFERQSKKKLMKVLIYPVILFVFLASMFFVFRLFFLPNITNMFAHRSNAVQSRSLSLSSFFLHLPDYIVMFIIFCLILIGCLYYIFRKKSIQFQFALLSRLPIVCNCWRMFITKQFAQSISSLLLTGFSLQQSLAFLKEQTFQPQLSFIANQIEQRIIFGDSLATAISYFSYFFPQFEEFIDHGEKSGLLGRELSIYCELLDEKIANYLKLLISVIQPILFVIIAICIVGAYLSILLPMYNLLEIL